MSTPKNFAFPFYVEDARPRPFFPMTDAEFDQALHLGPDFLLVFTMICRDDGEKPEHALRLGMDAKRYQECCTKLQEVGLINEQG